MLEGISDQEAQDLASTVNAITAICEGFSLEQNMTALAIAVATLMRPHNLSEDRRIEVLNQFAPDICEAEDFLDAQEAKD